MPEPWDLPEREVTPEAQVLRRRIWLKWCGFGGLALAAGGGLWWWRHRGTDAQVLGTGSAQGDFSKYYPAPRNGQFADADRPLTAENEAARYCNFYEFTGNKDVWSRVERFQPLPWTM